MNAVRKHLSGIKGGGFARLLAPARIAVLILSDVVGDDPGTIASGPLAPDPTTFGDCLEILRKPGMREQIPPAIKQRFELGAAGRIEETPKKGDPVFQGIESFIIGSNAQACTAAAQTARRLGYHVQNVRMRKRFPQRSQEDGGRRRKTLQSFDNPRERLAAHLAQRLGGSINVETRAEGGTQVRLAFPAKEKAK